MNKLIFKSDVYIVYVDGIFAGICENEDEICDVAQDSVNGISTLLDDDYPDRVSYDKINVNRFYRSRQTVCDKLSDDRTLCYDYIDCEDAVMQMNQLQIEKERAEAKLRAMTL